MLLWQLCAQEPSVCNWLAHVVFSKWWDPEATCLGPSISRLGVGRMRGGGGGGLGGKVWIQGVVFRIDAGNSLLFRGFPCEAASRVVGEPPWPRHDRLKRITRASTPSTTALQTWSSAPWPRVLIRPSIEVVRQLAKTSENTKCRIQTQQALPLLPLLSRSTVAAGA